MTFNVIPAIDLRGGQVVRLKQGDYAQQTDYPFDPVELASRYASAGARWLHLVDLDGARSGSLDNLKVIEAIAANGMQVQAGGGVRSEADLHRLFDAGVERVVLGSVAIRDPEMVAGWLESHGPERLTLALDQQHGAEQAEDRAGCAHYSHQPLAGHEDRVQEQVADATPHGRQQVEGQETHAAKERFQDLAEDPQRVHVQQDVQQ